MSPEMLPANSLASVSNPVDLESLTNDSMFNMNSGIDLYHLMAGNLELIELYVRVNKNILEELTPR